MTATIYHPHKAKPEAQYDGPDTQLRPAFLADWLRAKSYRQVLIS